MKVRLIILLFTIPFGCQNTANLNYLVTGSTSQQAIDAGMRILAQGGTAMDAALSVALSQNAASGGKYVSYAGMLNLLYYEAGSGSIHNLNASFNTVQYEADPLTIPKVDYTSKNLGKTVVNGRTVLVPGFMKGVEAAHKRFGKVPFSRLFEHAISVAETGIEWSPSDNYAFTAWKDVLTEYPETKAVFTKSDGSYYKVGDTFMQPQLAKTLKRVAVEGAAYLYTGDWAVKFVSTVRAVGGKITMQDMKDYDVIWAEPVHGRYHGYDVYVHGEPASGGKALIEALNLAEVSKLSEKGHYAQSPEALFTLYQIAKAPVYWAYKPEYFDESVDTPPESRLKKATAEKVWSQISQEKLPAQSTIPHFRNGHSDAIVAIDRCGNMVALIHSINTMDWGSNGLFVDGISIPDPASFQQKNILKAGPGNRLSDGTNPGFVLKDENLILGFSCIGSGLLNQSLTSLLNVLDFHMTPKEAIEAPSIGRLSFSQDKLTLSIEPYRFSHKLIESAERLGGSFTEDRFVISGHWTGVFRDYERGEISATEVWRK